MNVAVLPTGYTEWLGLPLGLGQVNRQHHPKAYLQWLCRAPQEPTCTHYDEADNGVEALAHFPWDRALNAHPHGLAHLRAMVEDLEDVLGAPALSWTAGGSVSSVTSVHHHAQAPMLRNA